MGYHSESLGEYSYSQCLSFDDFRIKILFPNMKFK
jgi:hypothetical protein